MKNAVVSQVPRLNQVSRLGGLLIAIFFLSNVASAQDYLQSTGLPSFSVVKPVAVGGIDISNGNLHLEIPVGIYIQRGGHVIQQRFTYDSRIWKIALSGSSQSWSVDASSGWQGQAGFASASVNFNVQSVPCGTSSYNLYSGYTWLDEHQTSHFFPIAIPTNVPSGCNAPAPVLTAYSTDSSGFFMSASASAPTTPNVYYPDGTIFMPANVSDPFAHTKDANGNEVNYEPGSTSQLVDTLGRQFTYSFSSANPAFSEPNSQGGTSSYQATGETISVSTAFGQSGVSEFSGNITVFKSIGLPDGSTYQFQYDSYGELSGITLPTGASVTFAYTNFVDAYGNVNRWATSYTMSGGTWSYSPQVISTCPSGQQGCQQKVTVTKPSGDSEVYTFTMNGGAWPVQVQYFNSTSILLLTTTHDYDLSHTCSGCSGAAYVTLTRETNVLPTVGGGSLTSKTEYTYDNINFGNVVATKEWNFYTGTPSGTPDRETDVAFLNSSAYVNANIVNRPSSVTVKNAAGTQLSQTLITYDSTALTPVAGVVNHDDTNYGTGNTVRGNPTVVQQWISGTTFLSTTLAYDTTGQLLQRTDPAGNIFSFGYSDRYFNDNGSNPPASFTPTTPTNAFLTSITVPLVGTETAGRYFGTGKMAAVTDQNSATSYFHYVDPLDRRTEFLDPIGGWMLSAYPSATEADIYTTLTDASPSTSCTNCRHDQLLFDTVGRLSTSALVNDPDGQINVQSSYDSSGRLSSITNPYRSTTESTYGTTGFTYDGLDRTTQITRQDGNTLLFTMGAALTSATQICGNGLAYPTVQTDEAGKKKQVWRDAFGRLIEVDEPDGSGTFTIATCSQYDALNSILNVTQQGGTTNQTQWRTRNYAYDGLSRPTSVTTPEGGATTYNYTTSTGVLCAGESSAVCRRTDARGITITYGYDALSRPSSKTYSDSTPRVSYFYDQTSFNGLTITNGKGRRTGMTDGTGQTAWSYDQGGHLLVRQQTIAGITKSITYTYNLDGSVHTITYPSGRTYTYGYNNALRPVSVTDSANGINYATSTHYAAPGFLTSTILGAVTGWNAITETNSYNNRLQPTQLLATSPVPLTLINLSFSYDQGGGKNNGNVVQVSNGRDSTRSVAFTYDQLNRLISAATNQSTTWGDSYAYDNWGNLLQKTVTQGTAESLSVTVNAKNQVTSPPFTYDADGNITWDTTNSLKYDAEGRMTPASGSTYSYDGEGRRVETSDGTMYWVDDDLRPLSVGTTSGSITRDYVFMAGRRIGALSFSNGFPYYYLSDQANSTAVISSGDGKAVQWEADYFPWGSVRTVITNLYNNHYQFTGYEFDSGTGYNYAVARYQSGRWGRFLSPDLLGGDLSNPQSLNRYAYVLNNPCTLIDPFGLSIQCTFNIKGVLGSQMSDKAIAEMNRILAQADVQAFDTGTLDPSMKVDWGNPGMVAQMGAKFGAVKNGTVYIDTAGMEAAAAAVDGDYDLGLGRVMAHEIGHLLGLPGDGRNQPGIMGGGHSHNDTQTFANAKDGPGIWYLTQSERSALLEACKELPNQPPTPRPGHRGGFGGGGGMFKKMVESDPSGGGGFGGDVFTWVTHSFGPPTPGAENLPCQANCD